MEDTLPTEEAGQPVQSEAVQPEIVSNRDCAGCGQPAMDGDHPTPLCAGCRSQFVRFPIPLWIRVFAACIGALVLFSLFTFPKDLSLGIGLEKGERAEKEKNYVTAQRTMEAILQKVPGNIEAEGHLMIDAFYNQDMQTFAAQFKNLKDAHIEDKDLFASMEKTIEKADSYFNNDSFSNFMTAYPNTQPADSAWAGYFIRNQHDAYALLMYASILRDRKDYARTDSCLRLLLSWDRESYPALELMSSLKREEFKPDEALIYNDRLLNINRELSYGVSSKARTLLMQKKDREALDLALKASELKKDDSYAQATLILAYHYNHRLEDRDALIKKARTAMKDSSENGSLQYALDVINNKEKFRD